ncbi:MazG nucleotide pyrophosphohydrolase domain-containing protein [Thermosediminibacter litoriperuensis]|uniref:MazG-like nucleotide pyrophosphohydrolase family protein n=1 Tax=Thermosediminibacter litoriperuensis TaxID=291989 RepID=A0A5S5AYV1_9FIRM|nr:MazG nucleotide pyrophosphohydrolase domain-containing protein [Thermosediminibacter litoriperuensis]TYP59887.1 MazG-like nucleotide pyrophosphohydrolase family protein [Thermosediminibacter litoriperuensis]
MELQEAMNLIWENRKYETTDPKEAISHLNEEVAESLKALLRGETAKAKRELEDALSCLLIALKVMGINPDEAVMRQVNQMKQRHEKLMIFKKERVEIYVNGVLKGGWSIGSEEDIKEAEKIAKEFGCNILYKNQ